MNISLTPHLEEYIQKKVTSGRYNLASEVVSEALRLLEEQDKLQEMRLEALRQEIQAGLDSGEAVPFDAEIIRRQARQR